MVCERVMIIERENKAAPSCVPNHSVKGGNYKSARVRLHVCETERNLVRMAVDKNNYQMYVKSRHFLLLCLEKVSPHTPPVIS